MSATVTATQSLSPTFAANATPTLTKAPIILLPDQSISGILVWFVLLIQVTIVVLIVFELARRRQDLSHVYYTRIKTHKRHAPEFPSGPLAWIHTVFSTPDDYIKTHVGLDAFMFLSYLRMAFQLFLCLLIILMFILIPVNYKANNSKADPPTANMSYAIVEAARQSLNQFSVEHVADGSNTLWVHVVCAYAVSILVYTMLYRQYHAYALMIQNHLSGEALEKLSDETKFRSIMITRLPMSLSKEAGLRKWFEALGIGQVESVCMVSEGDTTLLKLTQKREKTLLRLEKAYMTWAMNLAREFRQPILWDWKLPSHLHFFTTQDIIQLHTKHIDIPSNRLTENVLEKTRPIGMSRKTLLMRDTIRTYNRKLLDLTERIIWTRTKSAATAAMMQEMDLSNDQLAIMTQRHGDRCVSIDQDLTSPDSAGIEHSLKRDDVIIQVNQTSSALIEDPNKIPLKDRKSTRVSRLSLGSNMSINLNLEMYHQLNVPSYSAFVTFADRRSAFMARQLSLNAHMNPFTMHIEPAPAPNDIIWSSLSLSLMSWIIKHSAIEIICYLLCIGWAFPASYISTMSRPDVIASHPEYTAFLLFLAQSPWLYTLVTTVGPPLVIQTVNVTIPYLLSYLTTFQGIESRPKLQQSTMSKCFFFLLFNVHFVYTLFSMAWSTSSRLFLDPISWAQQITTTLPSGAPFFINYLILNVMLLPIELLRPVACIYHLMARRWLKTPREHYELSVSTSALDYAFLYPIQILIFVIVLCYSIISPLVLLPGVVYFGVAWVVYKNQLLFAYVKQFEDDGTMWLMAYHRSVIGLGIFQFSAAVLLSLKKAPMAALACGILIFMTSTFYYACRVSFERHTRVAPLERLVKPSTSENSRRQSSDNQDSQSITSSPNESNRALGQTTMKDRIASTQGDINSLVASDIIDHDDAIDLDGGAMGFEDDDAIPLTRQNQGSSLASLKDVGFVAPHMKTIGVNQMQSDQQSINTPSQKPIPIKPFNDRMVSKSVKETADGKLGRANNNGSSMSNIANIKGSQDLHKPTREAHSNPNKNNTSTQDKNSISKYMPRPLHKHKLLEAVSMSVISIHGAVANTEEHQNQTRVANYMSPAYSMPLQEPWIPEYIVDIVRQQKEKVTVVDV